MNVTKIAALILSACMTVTTMAGCGDNNDRLRKAERGNAEFVPQKEMKISVWVTQGSDYVPVFATENNVVRDWLQEKTKVTVENAYGNGGGSWENVLAKMISSEKFPEIIGCGGGQGPAHFAKLAEIEEIWELTPELLQTYAPDVWEKVPEEMWERMKVNGKIYGIPYCFPVDRSIDPEITDEELELWGNEIPSTLGTSLWIRDDILKMIYPEAKSYDEIIALMREEGPIGDKIYDVPLDSTEKIVDLMRKIKALNLKSGEDEVYAFGYSGADCWVAFAALGSNMTGYVGHDYITSWNTETQEIEIPLLGETIKETAFIQSKLIREKVIDPESLMHTDAQCMEKVMKGQYAIAALPFLNHPPTINRKLDAAGAEFNYRPLYTNVPPKPGFDICTNNISWGKSLGILKTVSEEDLPQILNWINVQFTDEWEEVRYWGPEEAGLYEDQPDGGRLFKDEELNKKFIYKESTSILDEECYGLNDGGGSFFVQFKTQSKWDPMIYNNNPEYVLVAESGGRITQDSPYKAEAVVAPPYNAWDAEYADLPMVTEFWSTRAEWEEPFKLALVAKDDKEFEEKWQAAVLNLKSSVDVETLMADMTQIARSLIE